MVHFYFNFRSHWSMYIKFSITTEGKPDRPVALFGDVNWAEQVSNQSLEPNSFATGANQTFAEKIF